ncbi:MAG: hypothetical protein ABR875_03455 [Minisyncoccia bacterium]|jgi:hypothetical protein
MEISKYRIAAHSLSWKWLLGSFAIVVVAGLLLTFACFAVNDTTKTWSGECKVVSWEKGGFWSLPVEATVSNGAGITATFDDPNVVVSFLQNPGPMNCQFFKSGRAVCDPRPAKTEKAVSH